MHEYDVAFKLTLQQVDVALRELTGTAIAKWHNVELPAVQNTRVDLLGETEAGELIHIELQSSNDPTMPVRMLEYGLRVYRLFGQWPQQVLVYVGEPPLRMQAELHGPTLQYHYRLIDIRELDGELLLASGEVADNIVAILTRLPDARAAIHHVLKRIGELTPGTREAALGRLMILAGLRQLGRVVEEEAKKMPILNDILEHEVLGRELKRGIQQGRQEGIQQGEQKVLRHILAQRFGTLPDWAERRIEALSATELEALSLRVLQVRSLEELLS